MGRASTGEVVYYHSAGFQCGHLPKNDFCWWLTLMLSYTIGSDNMSAIAGKKAALLHTNERW